MKARPIEYAVIVTLIFLLFIIVVFFVNSLLMRNLLNTLPDIDDISSLATGEWDLHVPVYVSHGEKEDHRVVARIRDGSASINNIFLLSEHTTHQIAGMRFECRCQLVSMTSYTCAD